MFKNILTTLMNFFGYEKFVKISTNDVKVVWFRSYKIRPKTFAHFLLNKAFKRKNTYTKSELWKYDHPNNRLIYGNGNKAGPTDYVIYLRPEAVKLAVQNPVSHVGSGRTKVGEILK